MKKCHKGVNARYSEVKERSRKQTERKKRVKGRQTEKDKKVRNMRKSLTEKKVRIEGIVILTRKRRSEKV